MNTFLMTLVLLLSSILSFLVGYSYRRRQEEKMKRRVWANIVKRLHVVKPLSIDHEFTPETEEPNLFHLEILENELKVALLNEDYEEAARIRDLLNKLGL